MNHCELISFLKKYNFFLPVNEGRRVEVERVQVQVQSWRQMKLTDNIFAYHTFIYIRQKAKVNLELRVKEPAPPSPALSEFKKIFSHTRLKLPPLGLTSLTLSLYIFVKEPALLLEVHFPIPFSSYRVDFLWGWLPMDMNVGITNFKSSAGSLTKMYELRVKEVNPKGGQL